MVMSNFKGNSRLCAVVAFTAIVIYVFVHYT
jgi:hypothetical protein